MIIDKIENANLYRNLSSGLKKGFEFIEKTDLDAIDTGRYDICEGVFAMVSEYNTKISGQCKPEAHRNYIDIQFIIKGTELIGYAPLNGQDVSVPYDAEKDLVFYHADVSHTELKAGMFAIYFPTDIHQPGVMVKESSLIKKIVVKVALL